MGSDLAVVATSASQVGRSVVLEEGFVACERLDGGADGTLESIQYLTDHEGSDERAGIHHLDGSRCDSHLRRTVMRIAIIILWQIFALATYNANGRWGLRCDAQDVGEFWVAFQSICNLERMMLSLASP